MSCRKLVFSLTVVALLNISSSGLKAAEAPSPGLSGAIRNSNGQLLDGVEVLVVPLASALLPLTTVLSDTAGQFVVPRLPPGVYRLAAIKSGYITWIAQIDTRSRRWIDVILRPTPPSHRDSELPVDSAWVLRLPRRTVFRETDPGGSEPEAPRVFASRGSNVNSHSQNSGPPLSVQVEHLVAVSPLASDDAPGSEISGSETRLQLSAGLGERASLHVRGRMHNVGSQVDEFADAAGVRADASEINVDFAYATGVDGQVEVSAWYGLSELAWDGFGAGTATPLQQGLRSWGYRSMWQQQIDPLSSVEVQMVYDERNSTMTLGPVAAVPNGRLASRAVEVAGVYDRQVSPTHQIQAGFSARRIESPSIELLTTADPFWSFEAKFQDSWTVVRPLTLIYGVSYEHAFRESDAALVVARAGASWNLDKVRFKLLGSYHRVAHWEAIPSRRFLGKHDDPVAAFVAANIQARPDSDVGYTGSVEVRLARGLSIEATTSWSPLQLGGVERFVSAEFGDMPIYETGGSTAVGEVQLALIHNTGSVHTYVELSRGQVEGVWSPGAARFDLDAVSYENGRWGLRLIPSGTDVQLSYRRIGTMGADSDLSAVEQSSLELRVTQELMRLEELGSWRLLVALRKGSLEDDEFDVLAHNFVTIGALSSGVSAGVSVQF